MTPYGFKRANRDDNHAVVVAALKSIGCHVSDLAAVGGGIPDLLVSRNGASWLIEVKNDETHGRRAKNDAVPHYELLTDEQIAWLASWRGPKVHIVTTALEALEVVAATTDELAAQRASLATAEKHHARGGGKE